MKVSHSSASGCCDSHFASDFVRWRHTASHSDRSQCRGGLFLSGPLSAPSSQPLALRVTQRTKTVCAEIWWHKGEAAGRSLGALQTAGERRHRTRAERKANGQDRPHGGAAALRGHTCAQHITTEPHPGPSDLRHTHPGCLVQMHFWCHVRCEGQGAWAAWTLSPELPEGTAGQRPGPLLASHWKVPSQGSVSGEESGLVFHGIVTFRMRKAPEVPQTRFHASA